MDADGYDDMMAAAEAIRKRMILLRASLTTSVGGRGTPESNCGDGGVLNDHRAPSTSPRVRKRREPSIVSKPDDDADDDDDNDDGDDGHPSKKRIRRWSATSRHQVRLAAPAMPLITIEARKVPRCPNEGDGKATATLHSSSGVLATALRLRMRGNVRELTRAIGNRPALPPCKTVVMFRQLQIRFDEKYGTHSGVPPHRRVAGVGEEKRTLTRPAGLERRSIASRAA